MLRYTGRAEEFAVGFGPAEDMGRWIGGGQDEGLVDDGEAADVRREMFSSRVSSRPLIPDQQDD